MFKTTTIKLIGTLLWFVMTTLLSIFYYYSMSANIETTTKNNLRSDTDSLVSVFTPILEQRDYKNLQQFVSSLAKMSKVTGIIVLDPSARIISEVKTRDADSIKENVTIKVGGVEIGSLIVSYSNQEYLKAYFDLFCFTILFWFCASGLGVFAFTQFIKEPVAVTTSLNKVPIKKKNYILSPYGAFAIFSSEGTIKYASVEFARCFNAGPVMLETTPFSNLCHNFLLRTQKDTWSQTLTLKVDNETVVGHFQRMRVRDEDIIVCFLESVRK